MILTSFCKTIVHFSFIFLLLFARFTWLTQICTAIRILKLNCQNYPKKKKKKAFRVSPRYSFTGQNSKIFPVRLVYFSVRNRGCTCTSALASIVYTGRYGTVSPTLSSTDCIYRGLKGNFNPMLNICSTDNLSIEINEN